MIRPYMSSAQVSVLDVPRVWLPALSYANKIIRLQIILSCIIDKAMFYVDDGCHSEGGNSASDDFPGTYKSINFEAGVRCCDNYGTSCITIGHCLDNKTNYYEFQALDI